MIISSPQLPIESALPELKAALDSTPNVVLSAEPGAGKTTRVPLILLESPWLAGKRIVMLEPRRLAARRAAEYMARQLQEDVGETVGFRMRGESRIGANTRIEIVTEAILTRQMHGESDLPGIGLLIFDEFHERSIHADLGLAFALDVQRHLRPDLRILVMSATLDGLSLQSLLGNAPIVRSAGRQFPVDTRYLGTSPGRPREGDVASAVVLALDRAEGDVLVFLPGRREIRRVETLLYEKRLPEEVTVHALFGDAPADQQRAALAPPQSGRRKVILATSVAETSLTIDGVRTVVDSGLARMPRFDPRRGMSGLETVPVSRATADQRRGRAGRQAPGLCLRLWTEREHEQLQPFPIPEIVAADLAPLALDLARWGSPNGEHLRFLDRPPEVHLRHAQQLLQSLGATEDSGRLTDHGRALAELPVHPRLAHMIIKGNELGFAAPACDLAALLEDRELSPGKDFAGIDLRDRWHTVFSGGKRDPGTVERVMQQSRRLREIVGLRQRATLEEPPGFLLGLAYPERLARRREGNTRRYLMAGGTGAILPEGTPLLREQYLAIGEVDGAGTEVRVYLAAPITQNDISSVFADQLSIREEVVWDPAQESVVAHHMTMLGSIPIATRDVAPSPEIVAGVFIEGIREMGLGALPWTKEAHALRARSEWIRTQGITGAEWPDLRDAHLVESLGVWLAPHLAGKWRRAHLQDLHMAHILRGLFTAHQSAHLDQLAPSHFTLPSGSRVAIDYESGPVPVLAVRLQEMFGQRMSPSIGGGRTPLLLHLLSPAHRPLAVTQDLTSFWKTVYPQIRTSMRARYPRHAWPEDPLSASPPERRRRKG
jgi:ATP-dependent helicase HrpB